MRARGMHSAGETVPNGGNSVSMYLLLHSPQRLLIVTQAARDYWEKDFITEDADARVTLS
jgi:hypothetical protein